MRKFEPLRKQIVQERAANAANFVVEDVEQDTYLEQTPENAFVDEIATSVAQQSSKEDIGINQIQQEDFGVLIVQELPDESQQFNTTQDERRLSTFSNENSPAKVAKPEESHLMIDDQ